MKMFSDTLRIFFVCVCNRRFSESGIGLGHLFPVTPGIAAGRGVLVSISPETPQVQDVNQDAFKVSQYGNINTYFLTN